MIFVSFLPLFAVRNPSLQIMRYPSDSHLFTGLEFNLTCQIGFAEINNVTLVVSASWKKNGLNLVSTDMASLEEGIAREVSPGIYEHYLFFGSLNLEVQGNYSCESSISVNAEGFQSQASNTAYYAVTIERESTSVCMSIFFTVV